MLSIVRAGLRSLPATTLIQASLMTAVSAKSATLRVTDNIRHKHKKPMNPLRRNLSRYKDPVKMSNCSLQSGLLCGLRARGYGYLCIVVVVRIIT